MEYLDVAHSFGVLHRRSQAFIAKSFAHLNIGYIEFVLLQTLLQGDGLSQDDLAMELTADKSLVARNVKTLEEKGYIRRVQDTEDRRYKHLYVTKKGKYLQPFLQETIRRWMDILTQDIDETLVRQTISGMALAADNAVRADINVLTANKGGEAHEET